MVHDTPTWYDTTVAEKGLAAAAKSCTFKYGQKRARPTREVYRQQTTWRIEYRQTTQHSVMEHAQSSTNWTRTPSSVHFVKGPGHTQPSHVHYVLHVLIKFSLQYAWYFAMEASFDFSIHDMSLLRRWWCVILVENFGLEGYGKRFAHYSEGGRATLSDNVPRTFRISRKRTHASSTMMPLDTDEDHSYNKRPYSFLPKES
ncbi:uncharacterized protein LOC117538676 isoform X2 [Gymnodraco acuticeps]|nr:uncharacterized protein LOC117538676 isoform X2 [Gymnodraco acuticeps]